MHTAQTCKLIFASVVPEAKFHVLCIRKAYAHTYQALNANLSFTISNNQSLVDLA
jgi:hypothetical protein